MAVTLSRFSGSAVDRTRAAQARLFFRIADWRMSLGMRAHSRFASSPLGRRISLLAGFLTCAALGFGTLGCAEPRPKPDEPTRLEPITVAPDFSAPDETGKLRSLSEFRGRALVLYFYPKDGTPGCTREACAFRDEWQRIQRTGARVVGVSLDSVESHAAFKQKHSLPFPLLSDTDGRVLRAYGVPKNAKGYASRTTFIIDAKGVIRRIFPEVDPAVHVTEVLEVLSQLHSAGLD